MNSINELHSSSASISPKNFFSFSTTSSFASGCKNLPSIFVKGSYVYVSNSAAAKTLSCYAMVCFIPGLYVIIV